MSLLSYASKQTDILDTTIGRHRSNALHSIPHLLHNLLQTRGPIYKISYDKL